MSIEKTLNTRIKLRYDLYSNWSTNNPKLLPGEVALAYIPTGENSSVTVGEGSVTGTTPPQVLIKVGDGEHNYNDLKYVSALAADVLPACKSDASLRTFINGVIADAGIASSEAMEALAGRVTTTETAIATLNGNAETTGSVAKAIKDAIEALNLADTYVAKEEGKSLVADTEITKLAGVSAGANKVEASENGKIKIDGVDTVVYTHPEKHAIADVTGLQDAIDDAKKAGTDANTALETYKGINDTAVKKVADDLASEVETARAAEKANADAIAAINNTTTGILATAKDYTDEQLEGVGGSLQRDINDARSYIGTLPEGASADTVIDYIDTKVASVTAADASVTVAGTSTAPTVAAKLSADADNALTLAADGLKVVIPAAAEYSIVKAADSGDYAAVYNLTKDGTIVGASINIPKDIVVKSGSVVGDEIVLVLNDEAATEIKIPVASLIEYVTSGSATGDMVVVNVSDDHKVTATITDGTITLAKLTTEVQTAIGKAHSHENESVLAGITADKVQAWDGAQAAAEATAAGALASAKSELEGKIAAAQTAAEKVANDNNTAMNTRVEALEAIDHDAYVAADATLKTELQGEIEAAKTDASNKDTVVLAEAQKGIAAVQTALDTHADNEDIHVTAEQKNTWNTAVQTVTAAEDSGLKATKTGTDVAIEINDSITWIFDCGTASSYAE